jgi:UDP-N-acetyl-D-galactosamine dehydrogenase
VDTYNELRSFGIQPIIHDPHADSDAVRQTYGVKATPLKEFRQLDALVYAVSHGDYLPIHDHVSDMLVPGGVLADLRSKLDAGKLRPDITYWSL